MMIFPAISGTVDAWEVIVFGHLRWNRYFGENADNPPRGWPSTCGSALVTGKTAEGGVYRLLIDPTLRREAAEYDFDINRRTGLHLGDITHCFSSHHHADHYEALSYFPNAAWYAADGVIPLIAAQDAAVAAKLRPASGEFLPGVYALPLPGHTEALHGVAFSCEGRRILVAGDAVMTKYHFRDERTEFQDDPALVARAAQTIRDIKDSFDLVLPGHDNLIITARQSYPGGSCHPL